MQRSTDPVPYKLPNDGKPVCQDVFFDRAADVEHHIVDSFGAIFLVGGIGLSGYMTGTIAMALIIAYFLLAIEIYLATYAVGVFRLSFGIWGPTELRIVLAIGTLVLLKKPVVGIGDAKYLLCDVGGVVAIVVMTGFAIYSAICNTIRLYREERLK